jgi:hypothetical protein
LGKEYFSGVVMSCPEEVLYRMQINEKKFKVYEVLEMASQNNGMELQRLFFSLKMYTT